MRIAVIGSAGQLGTALMSQLGKNGLAFTHANIELTNAANVRETIGQCKADAVINAAAYNLVDKAEDEPEKAYAVNALGPRHLAVTCADLDIPLLHVSTDYVFGLESTRNVPYRETDPPAPLSSYGVSKLAGEYFVRSICPKHFVVRTCGLYGHAGRISKGKGNFVETMLKLGQERDELSIVDDQHCTPSNCDDVAKAIRLLLETSQFGVYHATNSGQMTWRTFAEKIFAITGMRITIQPITTKEFGAQSARPQYSVLSNEKLAATIGENLPSWEDALSRYLEERGSQ